MESKVKTRRERRFQPAQFLAISFVVAIAAGTVLLLLPISTTEGRLSFVDALFTSTSAVCVTGLIVRDTATCFTTFGQCVILGLFQLGGLGIMTFSTLILLVSGKRVSIKDRIIIQEGFHFTSTNNVRSIIKSVFLYTLLIEAAGAVLFFFRWRGDFPFPRRVFASLFHSVSAFCNAGFSVFSRSFEDYRGDPLINITLMGLIVLGGMGFLVLHEMRELASRRIRRERMSISLHSHLVIEMTLFLIVGGLIFFMTIEWNHSLRGLPLGEKFLAGLFQVITPRTAGFNTMDLNTLGTAGVFLVIGLMFVGASPGSTGGGVKTSTIGVIAAFLRSKLAARDSVGLHYRTLSAPLITKAYTVVTLSILVIGLVVFALFMSHPGASMKEVFFEVFSAFGTVGLSLGLTAKLNVLGKLIIVLTMYIGRIGPLTFLFAFSREKAKGRYEYAEESVMIG